MALVHGAGRQLTNYCLEHGLTVVQHAGRRVTDPDGLEAAVKVFSSVNRSLTAALLAAEVRAVGFSAFDGKLVQSRRRPPIQVEAGGEKIDFGLVAEVQQVNPELVLSLWDAEFFPVVSSLCMDSTGQILNINADTLAAEMAAVLRTDSLVSVSDVEGIYLNPDDSTSMISRMSLDQARKLLDSECLKDGMLPKVLNAVRALERGVSRYHLVGGAAPDAILKTLQGEAGTIIEASTQS